MKPKRFGVTLTIIYVGRERLLRKLQALGIMNAKKREIE